MHLGGFLVLVGVILAALSVFLALPGRFAGRTAYVDPLLAVAVVLIGIGVLLGRTAIS